VLLKRKEDYIYIYIGLFALDRKLQWFAFFMDIV
jgi:hypothetical protein